MSEYNLTCGKSTKNADNQRMACIPAPSPNPTTLIVRKHLQQTSKYSQAATTITTDEIRGGKGGLENRPSHRLLTRQLPEPTRNSKVSQTPYIPPRIRGLRTLGYRCIARGAELTRPFTECHNPLHTFGLRSYMIHRRKSNSSLHNKTMVAKS